MQPKFRIYNTIQKKYLKSILNGFMVDTGTDNLTWQNTGELLNFPNYIVEQPDRLLKNPDTVKAIDAQLKAWGISK